MLRCGGVQSESIKHPDSEDTDLLCRIGSWRMILSCVFGSREGMIVFSVCSAQHLVSRSFQNSLKSERQHDVSFC